MTRALTILTFLCIYIIGHSQPQNNNWFFPFEHRLSFSSGSPVYSYTGKIDEEHRGGGGISNRNGKLLFYCDGHNVWDSTHQIMSNGTGLGGGDFFNQMSCLVVPRSVDEREYFIFTMGGDFGNRILQYSIVDMTVNGGLGGVVVKNIPLMPDVCEKITAIRHCNKKDFWVIAHGKGSDAYYSFFVSEFGVDHTPVISHSGYDISDEPGGILGQMKGSPDGKKLAACHVEDGIELADFNNQTGVVSNGVEISGNPYHWGSIGVEFSFNSKVLYISTLSRIEPGGSLYPALFQYDLSLPTTAAIIGSKRQVSEPLQSAPGALLRGPDRKIYMVCAERNFLSAVNNPDIYGFGCGYKDTAVLLLKLSVWGLPNHLNDYDFNDSFEVRTAGPCTNVPVRFYYNATGDVTALHWDFDDPSSGPLNFSALAEPQHTYSSPGTYNVTLIKYSPCGNDTLYRSIVVGDLSVNLGIDKNKCENDTAVLDPLSAGPARYLWQDGRTTPTYPALTAGLYWVQVSNINDGCVKRDSVIITTRPSPFVSLGKDTALCEGGTILLTPSTNATQFTWQDNSVLPALSVNTIGTYWVQVQAADGCKNRDTILVIKGGPPVFTLGPDDFVCPGFSLLVSTGLTGGSYRYRWQDGSANATYDVTQNGLYYVDVSNHCGVSRDSITIKTGNCSLYIPTAFTPNRDGRNDVFRIRGTGLVSEIEIKVFDRSGQIVFSSYSKSAEWDGTLNGVPLPVGIYVYMIRYNEISDPTMKLLKGTVMMIR